MEKRILNLEDNGNGMITQPESMDPELLLEVIDEISAAQINTTSDLRKWVIEQFVNADQIHIAHGLVDRIRNRLYGVGKRGREFPISRSEVESRIGKMREKRDRREEQKRQTEAKKQELSSELGSEFVAANPELINLIIGGRFSNITDYGVALKGKIEMARKAFLATRPDGKQIFAKYLFVIMKNALEKYRNRTLQAGDAYSYMNTIAQVGGRSTFAEARKLGDEFMETVKERGEESIISEYELMYMSCVAPVVTAKSDDRKK
jgi:hypothetical protein